MGSQRSITPLLLAFERAPILFGVLLFPLAATGALATAGFFLIASPSSPGVPEAPRAVVAERDRRPELAETERHEGEQLDSVPATHGSPAAPTAAQVSQLPISARQLVVSSDCEEHPLRGYSPATSPRAPPTA